MPSTGGARGGGGGGGGNPPHPHPRSTEAPGGEAGETRAALKHGPPHPRRRARLTDRPRPRRREHTGGSAERRGDASPPPPPPGGPDGGARVGTGHRAVTPGAGGPARAHAGRAGGGGRAGARFPLPHPPPRGGSARPRQPRRTAGTRPAPGHARQSGRRGRGREGGPSSTHHATAGPEAAADTDGRPQQAWEAPAHRGAAPGQQPDGRRATRRLSGGGLGAVNRKSSGGERTAGHREGAQGPFKGASKPEVGHRGTRGPTAQGLQHKGGPMAPEDTDPAPGGPWQPRGARAATTTPPSRPAPRTLSRTRSDANPPPPHTHPARPATRARPLLLTRGREHFARGRPPPPHTKPLAAGEGTTPNSGEAGFGPERADRGHDTPSAIWSRRAQRGGGGWAGGDGEGAHSRRGFGSAWGERFGGGVRANGGANRATG